MKQAGDWMCADRNVRCTWKNALIIYRSSVIDDKLVSFFILSCTFISASYCFNNNSLLPVLESRSNSISTTLTVCLRHRRTDECRVSNNKRNCNKNFVFSCCCWFFPLFFIFVMDFLVVVSEACWCRMTRIISQHIILLFHWKRKLSLQIKERLNLNGNLWKLLRAHLSVPETATTSSVVKSGS